MIGGLLGGLVRRNEETGLNPLQNIAASMDALVMPKYRMGEQIRQAGVQRVAADRRNATIAEMQKRADAGDTVAQRYLQGIQSGALDMKTGFAGYLNEVAANERFQKQQAAAAARAGASAQGVQRAYELPDLSGVVNTMRDGSIVVQTVGGEVLTGKEADEFVQNARKRFIDEQRDLYSAREEGRGAGKLPTAQQIVQAEREGAAKVKFIEELNAKRGNIESTISNYQLALDALGQDAKTGRVVGMLPNVTATANDRNSTSAFGFGCHRVSHIWCAVRGRIELGFRYWLAKCEPKQRRTYEVGHRPHGGAEESIAGS